MLINIHRYNDPYLDNSLQSFHRLIKEIENQYPDVVQSQLFPDCLRMEIKDRERFLNLLDAQIQQEIRVHLYYSRQNKDGTTREDYKHYLPFLGQPPSQYPLTFRDDKRHQLLEDAFPKEPSNKGKPCFLCGRFPAQVELTQGVYPFVTKAASLTTADYLYERSISKTYHKVCSLCYLIASLGWCDPAIPYRSRIQIAPRQMVSFLWLPYSFSLEKLHNLKRNLPSQLPLMDEISNVKLATKEHPPSRYSLLLAFLESLLLQVAEREVKSLREVSLNIPDEWWFLRIPEGRGMKNVDLGSFSLPEKVKSALIECLASSLQPYAHLLGRLEIRDAGERRKREEERKRTDNLREELSHSFLADDYDSFARLLQPHPRWIASLPPADGEAKLLEFLKIWRCKDMFTEQELEVLRKAGRTIALISDLRGKPSVLYNFMDRVRTPPDMLDSLKEIGHLLIGVDFEKEEASWLSPDSLDQLVELINAKEKLFGEIKNTLGIFISVEYAKRRLRERRQTR
ncbi:MAG: hypothetical protein ACP5KZ_07105 [bacterium]